MIGMRVQLSSSLVSTRRFFLIHGIISRSFAPTFSIGCSAVMRRRDSSVGAPARFSRTKSFAYSPVWMRCRISFIALARALVDDLRPGGVLAVLGVVGDRVVHVADAALVDQVDDQLELVQALEVRHLRRVAGLDQRLEARLDQLDAAAAQHGLLAEEIGLGLFLEVGLDDAGLAAADRRRVGQRQVARLLRRIAGARRSASARRRRRRRSSARCGPGALGATINTSRSARGSIWP